MTHWDLLINRTYEAKRPATTVFGLLNDRQIVWIGLTDVQYDSPTVRVGSKYPTIPIEKFLKWAGRDVTAEMPKGEWRRERA